MQVAFTFWKNKKEHIFDILKYWDDQNRFHLKTRYDHRAGAYDWDLQMKLRDYGAQQICNQEYNHWRETGVAFTFPEFEYTLPNKTLATDIRKNGNQWLHRGYVGDMSVGPYISHGLDCLDQKMLKSNFGTNQCRATDITERNIYEFMWEIQNGHKFNSSEDKKSFRQYGAVKLQVGEAPCADRGFGGCNLQLLKYDTPLKTIANVKISFLSVEDVLNIQKKQQFHNKFDIVYVANNYFAFLKEDFKQIISDHQSLILMETKKYSTLQQKEISEGVQLIRNFCKELKPITSFSLNVTNSILKYKKNSL